MLHFIYLIPTMEWERDRHVRSHLTEHLDTSLINTVTLMGLLSIYCVSSITPESVEKTKEAFTSLAS